MNSNKFNRRILICVRGNCAHPDRGKQLEKRLAELIRAHGLDDPGHSQSATCTLTNCLAVCTDGPVVMVHPDKIRYHHVDEAALERIFREHILQNRPVEALIRREPPVIPVRAALNGRRRRKPGK